mmetsp:Transcript_14109/g.19810  ORF Transcript_14109/g.19810 Transcript_14109/m.19810 type:complete len:240 (+) Transcript_14109:141-860(+)
MVTKQGEVLYKEPEGILFQGYLQKQGAINKAFKTRYFRLVERPCQVWYYKNESSRTPRGGIKLCNSGVEITTSIPCMIHVKTGSRTYTLQAKSEVEAAEWTKVMGDAINEEKKRRRKKVERTWQKMKKEKGTEDDGDRGKMSGSLKKDKINQPDFRGRNDEKTGSSNDNNPPLTHRVAPTGRKDVQAEGSNDQQHQEEEEEKQNLQQQLQQQQQQQHLHNPSTLKPKTIDTATPTTTSP